MPADTVRATLRVAEILESLQVPFFVGGSIAGNVLGEIRSTKDVDFVADLREIHAQPLIEAMRGEFYVPVDMVHECIRERRIFNVIYLPDHFKVDFFPMRDTVFAREEMSRRMRVFFFRDPERTIPIATPEDLILSKLDWYRKGRGASDLQWRDVMGVLKVHGESLDRGYMSKMGITLGVSDLLVRALEEAGLKG